MTVPNNILLPILIIILFLVILYLRGAFHRKIHYRMKDIPSFEESHFPLAMMGVSASVLTKGYPTGFWYDIDTICEIRIKEIRNARRTIHFETFYMTPGKRVEEFAEAIIERSQAGVEVQLIADSFGVISISKEYWKRLRDAGVHVRFFHPFSWKHPLNYNIRTHRKLLLIDGEVAYVGGMGISDCWDGVKKSGENDCWLDVEVCFKGPIVAILEGVFMQQWLYLGGVATLNAKVFNPDLSGGSTIIVTPKKSPTPYSSVYALFYTSVLAAEKRIWIASPYFLPDADSRKALIKAKRNGLDVRILTVGPHNDKKMVYYAVRERYQELLAAGIEIYEHYPSMMHAKVLLIDDCWVSTGSTNYDPRSLFHNDELNISMAEPQLAVLAEDFFIHAFARSCQIDVTKWKKRPLWQRLLGRVALFIRWQL